MSVAAIALCSQPTGSDSRIPNVSWRSFAGLNSANFFLAEVTGVVLPFLAKFLAERDWRDDAIGIAACVAGLVPDPR